MRRALMYLAIALIAALPTAYGQSAMVVDFQNVAADTWLTTYSSTPYRLNGLNFYYIGYGELQRVRNEGGDHIVVDHNWGDVYGAENIIVSASGRDFYFNSVEYGYLPYGAHYYVRFIALRDGVYLVNRTVYPSQSGLTMTAAALGLAGVPIDELRINLVGGYYFDDLNVTLPAVVIQACDTGVQDRMGSATLSVQQLISEYAAAATSHDEFMANVAALTNDLKKADVITNEEKSSIRTCAAQSTIGE